MPTDDEQTARLKTLSAVYGDIAASLGVPYIETFSQLVDDEAYAAEVAAYDGAHPRSTGYAKLTNIIGSSPHWWFS